jgi:hypothetical protein
MMVVSTTGLLKKTPIGFQTAYCLGNTRLTIDDLWPTSVPQSTGFPAFNPRLQRLEKKLN